MNIANFNGYARFLMEETDGGEGGSGGGGGSDTTALATTTDTALATTDETAPGGEETALTATNDDGTPRDVDTARPAANPALAVLKAHADPIVKKFADTAIRAVAFRKELGVMFPGVNPKAAVQSLVSDMVSLAGRNYNTPDPRDPARRTGLQQVRDRLAEIEEIDLMFYGGNPQLLDGMTSDDEGKAAFAKLSPHMEGKWKEIAPNAWAAKTARQILADMKGAQLTDKDGNYVADADIPYRVQRLSMSLRGDKDGNLSPLDLQMARNEVAAIAMYLQRLSGLTSLAPEVFTQAKDATDSKLAERERKLAEREANTRNNEWNSQRQIMANQITTKTWNQLVKGHEIAADDQEECIALFQRRFEAAIKAREPRADDNRKGYIESDDRDGYLAYENYLMTTYGVPALKEQVRRMLAKMVPLTPSQRAAAKTTPAAGTTAAAKPPAAGHVKLMAKPPSHVLDYSRMTPEMVKAKQGILRLTHDGKPAGSKVAW